MRGRLRRVGRGRNPKRRRRRRQLLAAKRKRLILEAARPAARGPRPRAPSDAGFPPPLERFDRVPTPEHGLVAGDLETADIFGIRTATISAAMHTSKGVGYKDVNEDGAALFRDRAGHVYFGVFDQAGGMGLGAVERGRASAIAAARFFEGAKEIAENARDEGVERIALRLRNTAMKAHDDILRRGYDEATTFVGGRVTGRDAVIVSTGDSGVMLFKSSGAPVAVTQKHRLPPPFPQNILTDALGQSSGEPQTDAYHWPLERGDYLVVGSDGLLDSALSVEDFGRVLVATQNVDAATRELRQLVYQQMADRRAKSDNVSVIVLRIEA